MKPYRILTFTVCIALLLSACGALSQTSKTTLPPLKIAYTQWWGDYTILIAQEKGLFDKYNVDVEPIYYEVFTKAVPDIASGQIDGGTYIIGDMLNISIHTSVNVIAISDDGGTSQIITTPDITTISDLRGESIGVQIGSAYEMLIAEMLKTGGLALRDVNLVNVDAENVPQKISEGEIAAGLTWEPYTSNALDENQTILFSSEEISGLFANVIVLRSEVIDQRPDDARNYLKAWFEAVEFRNNNPQEANLIISQKTGIPVGDITEDARLFTLNENRDLFRENPEVFASSIYNLTQANIDFFTRNGKLSIIPDLLKLFNSAFLEE